MKNIVLNHLKFHNTLNGGSGHTDGTYYNVRLLNTNATPATAPWDGATAKVVVSGGSVTSVEITDGGSAYTNGETLFFDSQTPAARWYWWFTKCKFNYCNCWYFICNWTLYSSNWYHNWNRFLSSYIK